MMEASAAAATQPAGDVTSQASVSAHALHVLTMTPFYPRAGDESGGCFIAEPIAEMIRAGLRSTVVAVEPAYRSSPEATASAPEAKWCRFISLPGGMGLASAGRGLSWRVHTAVAELHRKSRIDLIHAHGALPCGHAAALLSRGLRIPYVISVHGLDAFSTMQVPGRAGERCRSVSARVFRSAARIIGVSRRVCEEVEKGIGRTGKTSVVYNGVDPELFKLGGEAPVPVLLSVGNLISSKGHELVVRALAALKPEFPRLTWQVIGDGPELNRLRQLAQQLGVLASVRFLGRRSRRAVAEACDRSTVFVLPSRSEGLGCVYLEAMASGKPSIGCCGQGIEEVIRHGENGILIPPDSLSELIEGLRSLLRDSDLRARMGVAARQTILSGFTLQHQAKRLMTVYQECAG